MNPHAKIVYAVLGVASIGTLFAEIWGAMFGWVRLSVGTAIAVACGCVLLFLIAITALDPPKVKG